MMHSQRTHPKTLFPVFALFFAIFTGFSCTAKTAPVQEPQPSSSAGTVIIQRHSSTDPEASLQQPFVECLAEEFLMPEGVTLIRWGGPAHYLSRFYGYTEAFHKAKRCDSILLTYHQDSEDNLRGRQYHVALFTFDDPKLVRQIRRLESRSTTSLRVPATGESPGSMTYKAGTERYRIYFSETQVIFIFYDERFNCSGEDVHLYHAALKVKNCMLDNG